MTAVYAPLSVHQRPGAGSDLREHLHHALSAEVLAHAAGVGAGQGARGQGEASAASKAMPSECPAYRNAAAKTSPRRGIYDLTSKASCRRRAAYAPRGRA